MVSSLNSSSHSCHQVVKPAQIAPQTFLGSWEGQLCWVIHNLQPTPLWKQATCFALRRLSAALGHSRHSALPTTLLSPSPFLAQMNTWDLICCCFHPLKSEWGTDIGGSPQAEACPTPRQSWLCEQRWRGEFTPAAAAVRGKIPTLSLRLWTIWIIVDFGASISWSNVRSESELTTLHTTRAEAFLDTLEDFLSRQFGRRTLCGKVKEPASSTKKQAQVPPTRKPVHGTDSMPHLGGRFHEWEELWPTRLQKIEPKCSKLNKRKRQKNVQQMKELG